MDAEPTGAMTELQLYMSWLDMSQYLDRFLQAGFDSWETIMEISEEDLEFLGVELGHRRRLQKEIAKIRSRSDDFERKASSFRPVVRSEIGLTVAGDDAIVAQRKRGYVHRPQPDSNAPERPYSAYVLFTIQMRETLKHQSLSFTEISRQIGKRWQSLRPDEKKIWTDQAAIPRKEYKADLARYQMSENYMQHRRYLKDFKATQVLKRSDLNDASGQDLDLRSNRGRWLEWFANPYLASAASSRIASTPSASYLSASTMVVSPSPRQNPRKRSSKRGRDASQSVDSGSPRNEKGSRLHRMNRACERCRRKKIKCSGERPTCQNCLKLQEGCTYADDEKEKEKK